MSECFVSLCNHRFGKNSKIEGCTAFRFPMNDKKRGKWDKLCRRADRKATFNDRMCSCHFEGRKKENGPSLFPWNADKLFSFPSPEKRKKGGSHLTKSSPASECDKEMDVTDVSTSQSLMHDHDYCHPCEKDDCRSKLQLLNGMVADRKAEISKLEEEIKQHKSRRYTTTYADLKQDEKMIVHYTSLTCDVFEILVALLIDVSPLNYYAGWAVTSISIEDQLLIALMKLRHNFKDIHLSALFGTSSATVSNIIHTIIAALHECLYDGIMAWQMPSQLKCKGCMPKSFECFPTARVAMDATEVTQDIPTPLDFKNVCYSNYKSRHTVKSVTCVAPNGAIVYASDLYPGSTSDKAIVVHSDLLSQFKPGDLILADKGFTLYDILPPGVNLNIPAFLSNKTHFTKEEATLCFKIAKARIHVERANERIKNFEILDHIHHHYRSFSSKIFQLCCALVNLQAPLIKEIADKYEM